jgi:hypothetical protein
MPVRSDDAPRRHHRHRPEPEITKMKSAPPSPSCGQQPLLAGSYRQTNRLGGAPYRIENTAKYPDWRH